jgi:hypothetical protein
MSFSLGMIDFSRHELLLATPELLCMHSNSWNTCLGTWKVDREWSWDVTFYRATPTQR